MGNETNVYCRLFLAFEGLIDIGSDRGRTGLRPDFSGVRVPNQDFFAIFGLNQTGLFRRNPAGFSQTLVAYPRSGSGKFFTTDLGIDPVHALSQFSCIFYKKGGFLTHVYTEIQKIFAYSA